MATSRTPVAVAFVSIATILIALPVQAEPSPDALFVWVRSDGTFGSSHVSDIGALDAEASCRGWAPDVNSCTLTGTSWSGDWQAGWLLPTPNGPFNTNSAVMSTSMEMAGSNGDSLGFECDWLFVGNGFQLPTLYCSVTSIHGWPTGRLTANFHTGALDFRTVYFAGGFAPDTNAVEAGLGAWDAILLTP